jgi:hypothetical protein
MEIKLFWSNYARDLLSDNSNKKEKKKRSKRKINWSKYNKSLVRRGEMLFDSGFLQNWRAELKKMNEGKEGLIIAIRIP